MDSRAVAKLLLFATVMDYRANNEPATVEAWLLVLDGDMEESWAAEFTRGHFANSTGALMAADLNAAWRKYRGESRRSAIAATPGHCGRSVCRCPHVECDYGWLLIEGPAVRCGQCNPPPGMRGAGHLEIMQ